MQTKPNKQRIKKKQKQKFNTKYTNSTDNKEIVTNKIKQKTIRRNKSKKQKQKQKQKTKPKKKKKTKAETTIKKEQQQNNNNNNLTLTITTKAPFDAFCYTLIVNKTTTSCHLILSNKSGHCYISCQGDLKRTRHRT